MRKSIKVAIEQGFNLFFRIITFAFCILQHYLQLQLQRLQLELQRLQLELLQPQLKLLQLQLPLQLRLVSHFQASV